MEQLLVVTVGGRTLGWRSGQVAEVFAAPAATPLPEPQAHLLGAAFHRGRLVTVADTASLVKAPGAASGRLAVRLAPPREHLAFSLDSVEAVVPYNPLDLREEPGEGLWEGLYPWGERWVPVVRAERAAAALGGAAKDGDGEEHGR